MATVDKLTIELNADGVKNFIDSLNNAQDALKKVQQEVKSTVDGANKADDKLNKHDRKNASRNKKKDEQSKKRQNTALKAIKDTNDGLNKVYKSLLAIAGISFGYSSLNNLSQRATAQSGSLVNQTTGINITPKQLEGLNTALQAINVDTGSLNSFLAKLSQTQSSFKYGNVAADSDIVNIWSMLQAFTGQPVSLEQDNLLGILDDLARALSSLSKHDRDDFIARSGIDQNVAAILTNSGYFRARQIGAETARQTPEVIDRNTQNQLALTEANKRLQNEADKLGENLTPFFIGLNDLGADLLKQLNDISPRFEEALPILRDIANFIMEYLSDVVDKLRNYGLLPAISHDNYIDDYLSNHPNLLPGERDTLVRTSKDITAINVDDGYIETNKYSYGENAIFNRAPSHVNDYLNYVLKKSRQEQEGKNTNNILNRHELPIGQFALDEEMLRQYMFPQTYSYGMAQAGLQNNSTVNIQEVNISEQQISTIDQLKSNVEPFSKFTNTNVSNAFNHLNNYH